MSWCSQNLDGSLGFLNIAVVQASLCPVGGNTRSCGVRPSLSAGLALLDLHLRDWEAEGLGFDMAQLLALPSPPVGGSEDGFLSVCS